MDRDDHCSDSGWYRDLTAANQPYYQYNDVLRQFELSAAEDVAAEYAADRLDIRFHLLVSAAVQWPDGFIDLQLSRSAPDRRANR